MREAEDTPRVVCAACGQVWRAPEGASPVTTDGCPACCARVRQAAEERNRASLRAAFGLLAAGGALC